MFLVDFGAWTTPSRRIFHTVRSLRIRDLSRAQDLLLGHFERRFKRQILPIIGHSDRNVLSTVSTEFACVRTNRLLLPARIGYSELYLTHQPYSKIRIGPLHISEDKCAPIFKKITRMIWPDSNMNNVDEEPTSEEHVQSILTREYTHGTSLESILGFANMHRR